MIASRPTESSDPSPNENLIVDRFELMEKIGEGGMGAVHRARDHRFQRDVAIKLLHNDRPADSPEATRFKVEAKITGQLQHPGIPPVYDLGNLGDGQPFLAMKLVKGQTLKSLLRDRTAIDLGRLIGVFEQVAHAVGYAHSNRVIHRDLKPENVMVGAHGEVQVMDWGIAKVLGGPSTAIRDVAGNIATDPSPPDDAEATSHYEPSDPDTTTNHASVVVTPRHDDSETRAGTVMGTFAFMPPEQAAGRVHDLDARSDVFGLGAILCSILTGRAPYSSAPADVMRKKAIRGECQDALAALDSCGTEPELVELCKRCLSFKQEDRPADGTEVATAVANIRQAAESRARQAELKREETVIRAAEQAKRRRLAQIAVSTVAVVLLVGLGISLRQMNRAISAEGTANQNAKDARDERDAKDTALQAESIAKRFAEDKRGEAELARRIEERERKYAQAIDDFVRDDFLALTSVEGQDRSGEGAVLSKDTTLRELLDRAAKKLQARKDLDPRTSAELHWIIGVNYRGVSEIAQAIKFLERSVELHEQALGAEDAKTLNAKNSLAVAYRIDGRFEPALKIFRAVHASKAAKHGVNGFDTLVSLDNLAACTSANGDHVEALKMYEQVRDGMIKLGKADDPYALQSLGNLASAYEKAGRHPEAIQLFESVLERASKRVGATHTDTLEIKEHLAFAYQHHNRLPDALRLFEELRDVRFKKFGLDHHKTLFTLNNLGNAYRDAGRLDEAIALHKQASESLSKKLGPSNPDTLTSLNNLGSTYNSAGRLEEAVKIFEDARDRVLKNHAADHPDVLFTINNLAIAYRDVGKLVEAIEIFESVRKTRVERLGPTHTDALHTAFHLAKAYLRANRVADSIALFEEVYQTRLKTLPADHIDLLRAKNSLAVAYRHGRRVPEAIQLLEEVRDARVRNLVADHPDTLSTLHDLGSAYCAANRTADGIRVFEQIRDPLVAKLGIGHPLTSGLMNNLAGAHFRNGEKSAGIKVLEDFRDATIGKYGEENSKTLGVLVNLAGAYRIVGKVEEAIKVYERVRDVKIKTLGMDNRDTLTTLNNLASVYQNSGRLGEAIELYTKVKDAQIKTLGVDDSDTLLTMGNLANALQNAGRISEALPLFEQAVQGIERDKFRHVYADKIIPTAVHAYEDAKEYDKAESWRRKWMAVVKERAGAESTDYGLQLYFLGSLLLNQKKWKEAEQPLRDALVIYEKSYRDYWGTFDLASMLGQALLGQKKYADAEPLLLKGYDGLKARQKSLSKGPASPLSEAINRIVRLYEALDKKEEAAKWRKVGESTK